jgi:aminoglycoside 6'-N-acetyltransferase
LQVRDGAVDPGTTRRGPDVVHTVTIRPMAVRDLTMVHRWLQEPHIARWFTGESTAEVELEKYRRRIERSESATTMCVVELGGNPVGWSQWYRWEDYPASASATGAKEGEVGADYALGETDAVGHGVGTAMVAAMVEEVRRHHPTAGLLVVPEASNRASRRVLEKNGFELVDVRPIDTEPHDRPMAIYRLAGPR